MPEARLSIAFAMRPGDEPYSATALEPPFETGRIQPAMPRVRESGPESIKLITQASRPYLASRFRE